MENKTMSSQKVTMNFEINENASNVVTTSFNDVEYEITKTLTYDRYLGISKYLLDKKRNEILRRETALINSVDIYSLIAEFKTMILEYFTTVDMMIQDYPQMEECGFIEYTIGFMTNYQEMYQLFLTEISVLNTQLMVSQIMSSIPNPEDAMNQFNKAMSELSDVDKARLEMVVGKRMKDEIREEEKAERIKMKNKSMAEQRAKVLVKSGKKVN